VLLLIELVGVVTAARFSFWEFDCTLEEGGTSLVACVELAVLLPPRRLCDVEAAWLIAGCCAAAEADEL
jgi:hypothetical protein